MFKTFSATKLDVATQRICPANVATEMLTKSSGRQIMFAMGDWVAAVSAVALLLDGLLYRSFHDNGEVAAVTMLICLMGFAFKFYTVYQRFDFDECSKHDYEEIFKLRQSYAAADEYVNAIRKTGRDWVSNYEYRAIQNYHEDQVREVYVKKAEDEFSSAKKKALS